MPIAKGYSTKCGMKVESGYGMPVQLGAGDLFAFLSEDIVFGKKHEDRFLTDKNLQTSKFVNKRSVFGAMNFLCRYAGIDVPLLLFFGHKDLAGLGGGIYRHKYYVNPSEQWRMKSATVCFDKQVSIWEYCGIVAERIRFNGVAGSIVGATVDLLGKNLDRDSATNSSSDAWSLPTDEEGFSNVVRFNHLTFKVKEYSPSEGFGPDDDCEITDFSLEIKNELNVKYSTDDDSLQYVTEPKRITHKISGSFTLPYYEDEGAFDAHLEGIGVMAELDFEEADYKFKIQLPYIRIFPEAVMEGPAAPQVPVSFIAEIPDVPAAGMYSEQAGMMLILENKMDS